MADQNEVPAFLKGIQEPTFRASGATEHFEPEDSLFGFKASGKSASPAPLKFSQPTSSSAADSFYGWGTPEPAFTSSSSQSKSKNLELGIRSSVAADFQGLSLSSPESTEVDPSEMYTRDLSDGIDEWSTLPYLSLSHESENSSEVLRSLSMALQDEVDFEVKQVCNQIQGVVHHKCERCFFAMQLHKELGAGGFRVDCLRLSGSPSLFATFLNSTSQRAADFFTSAQLRQPGRAAGLAADGAQVADAPDWDPNALDDNTCRQLLNMCDSEFRDVRVEALKTLAGLCCATASEKLLSAVEMGEVRGVLMTAGGAEDADERWYAACLMAALCDVRRFAADGMSLLPLLFNTLAAPTEMAEHGTQRRVARALELITKAHSSADFLGLAEMGLYLSVLESHFDSPDAELQASIRAITAHLSS